MKLSFVSRKRNKIGEVSSCCVLVSEDSTQVFSAKRLFNGRQPPVRGIYCTAF